MENSGTYNEMRRLMRAGETEALLQLISLEENPELQSIQSKLKVARTQYQMGLIDTETWIQIQLQVYQNLLLIPAFTTSESKSVVLNRAQIENLVLQHKIEEALVQCEPIGIDILLLHAQWSLLQKEQVLGKMEIANWELGVNKIKHAIMTLLELWTNKRADGLWTRLWNRLL